MGTNLSGIVAKLHSSFFISDSTKNHVHTAVCVSDNEKAYKVLDENKTSLSSGSQGEAE